jgi:transposase InsO family protein
MNEILEIFNFNREQAKSSIFEYIEVFYNKIRRHSTIGYCSPSEFYQKRAIPYKSLRFKSGLEISPKLGFYSKP